MKPELEALLKAYDAFKQTQTGRKRPDYLRFMRPSWRRHPKAPCVVSRI